MDEKNKVTVIVYGQEFTISGDMPREQILKMADKMDTKMQEVGAFNNEPISKIAVLAGMLIADENLKQEKDIDDLLSENGKLDSEAKRYEQMWEDVKESFAKYKEEVASLGAAKDNLQQYASEKEQQLEDVKQQLAQQLKYNEELRARFDTVSEQAKSNAELPQQAQRHIEELENKCRDIESSFFDIQMENIHLKNEIETLRGRR